MTRHLAQFGTLIALLILGVVAAPWAGSQTGDEWLHGERCALEGQGPVLCSDAPSGNQGL